MRTARLSLSIVLLIVVVEAAWAQTLLSSNQMVMVDGRPRFILGLYENPQDDALLKTAVKAGFNLIQAQASRASLDRLAACGVKGWVNVGGSLDLSRDESARRTALTKLVNDLKDHPTLLVWEGPDEILWNVWYADCLEYLEATEWPAMNEVIGKATTQPGVPANRQELTQLLEDSREMFSRGLYEQCDIKRAEFWKRAGKAPPRPEVKAADCANQARRIGDGIAQGIGLIHQIDPKHPVWLNHAPRNSVAAMKHFNRAADMAGCDIYPVPANRDQGHSDYRTGHLTSVGIYTDRMRAAAPGKACAMVLQGFGWRDLDKNAKGKPEEHGIGRKPNFNESRFMAYDAVVHGANAILYWGTAYIEKTSALWTDLLKLAGELSALEPALVASTVEPAPQATAGEVHGSCDGDGILLMLKKVESDYVLIVVNENQGGVPFTVRGLPADLEGKTLFRLGSKETVTVKDGELRDGIRGTNAHVYATSKAFEPKK